MGEGMLLLEMYLNFLMPTSLQSSASATITSGCLPIWNLCFTITMLTARLDFGKDLCATTATARKKIRAGQPLLNTDTF